MEKETDFKKVHDCRGVILIAIVAVVMLMPMNREAPEQKVAKLLDLGQKYLLEEGYEQAIATFDEIFAIAP